MQRYDFENQHMGNIKGEIHKIYFMNHKYYIVLMILVVQYLSAALGVRVTLKDVSHHGNVTFLHCPVEGGLSILM